MPIHFAFSPTFTLLPVILVLFSASFIPFINAQKFQPISVVGAGSAFIEGQGLYVFGGNDNSTEHMSITQSFMIDLSVSWNTSDPVIKKLADSPGGLLPKVTMLPNKEEIFLLTLGLGHTYNVKSNSWSPFVFNNKLPIVPGSEGLAADQESGILYFVGVGANSAAVGATADALLIAMDPRTSAFNTIEIPIMGMTVGTGYVWSASQRSLMSRSVLEPNIVFVYTPSRASESSRGWSMMNTTGDSMLRDTNLYPCFMPAYNGSKMVHFMGLSARMGDNGNWIQDSVVQILDIATRKWTTGPPTAYREAALCAVSGDQFIIWGGANNGTFYDSALVYNMKTNKWVTSYIAPPPVATTTLPTPTQRNPHTTTPSITGDTSTDDTKLVIIITVVTGVLLIIILTAIFIYLKTTKRSKAGTQTTNSNGSSSDSLGTVANIDIYGKVPTDALPRDPVFPGVDSKGASSPRKEKKFTVSGVLGLAGARPLSEHPHTIVEGTIAERNIQEGAIEVQLISQHPHAIVEDTTAKRNVQGGAIGAQLISQHPHAMTEQDSTTKYNDKSELESKRDWGDKEELEDE